MAVTVLAPESLRLENVTFGYSDIKEPPLIEHFNLEVPPGREGGSGRWLRQRKDDHRQAGLPPAHPVVWIGESR